jgi:hypothetical protein
MASSVEAPPSGSSKKNSRLGRRRRRALWSAGVLVLACLVALIVGRSIYRARQPAVYKPGEDLPDITYNLDRDAPAEGRERLAPPKDPGPTRSLRNLDRPLPAGAPQPRFSDVTRQSGLAVFRSFAGNRSSQLPEDMGSGLAWGDFDNDGNEDLFIVSAGGPLDMPAGQRAPSLLLRNLGDGTFQKVDSFPDTRIIGMGAAWGDYNNDGWLDLVVTGYNTLLLFRNDHGVLVRDTRFPNLKGFWTGATWGDYDRDGNLDLYVCGYVRYKPGNAGQSSEQFGLEVPFTLNPSSYEPERNLLFHNNGDGTFTEVAQKLGVDDPNGRSLGALWHDFDGDGWLDLYVANDVSENRLYLNKHGRFVDASSAAWVGEYRGSMGLAAGDWDRDGDDDLFISHWIAQQYALYQSLLEEQKFAAQKNGGPASHDLHFTDVAETSGIGQVSLQSIGWGTSFFDFDSDGWLDLVVANGSTFETKQQPRKLAPMPSFLFWNQKGEFFHNLAPWNVALSTPHASRGLAVADYNNDGALDIAIVDHGEGVRLLRNDVPQGNWLELRLHSRVGKNRQAVGFGYGATVIAYVNGVGLRRSLGSSSYLFQDSRRVHVGLGQSGVADRVEVRWLSGAVDNYEHLASNTIWDLTEGDPVARQMSRAPANASAATGLSPDQVVEFWKKQHLAMDALKKDSDIQKAARLFREAVALNPAHEDSRYYLANCLYAEGDTAGALEQLDALIRINPQSHRGYQRKGLLLAAAARNMDQLTAAESTVGKAQALNPEETGTLLLLGEIALLRGDSGGAQRQLEMACRTNPKAVGGYFLRGYLAWKNHDLPRARDLLLAAKNARGKDWKPAGSAAEGDVRARMHTEGSVLSIWETWDGDTEPQGTYPRTDRAIRIYAARLRP